jgi:predicted NAD/FAD-dependent oxidoreductase
MDIAIIGAGVSGATFSNLFPDAIVFEKSIHSGGRASTHHFSGREPFDIGATVFKDSLEYIKKGVAEKFNLLDFFSNQAPSLEVLPHKTYPNAYFPKQSMQAISEHLLKGRNIKFKHELESIQKYQNTSKWQLSFKNGFSSIFDLVILTAPVPQVSSVLKNSGIMSIWDDFIKFRTEYRSTLVLTGIWRNLSPELLAKIDKLEQFTFLNKEQDAEYISIENGKYDLNSLVVTIQFSESFSSKNLERWMAPDKKLLTYSLNSKQFFFDQFFTLIGLTELIGKVEDEVKVHKWRYAQSDFPIFKEDGIDLDNPLLSDLIELSKKHNLWISGDWIWGSRIIKNIFGAHFLSQQIKSLI